MSLKKLPIKLLSVILSLLLIFSIIPVALLNTANAKDNTCFAVEVAGKTVYFYGADSLEVNSNSITFAGESDTVSVYVDALKTDEGITVQDDTVTFDSEWLSEQTGWIAVSISSTIEIPASQPEVEIDNQATVIDKDSVSGLPTEWVKSTIVSFEATDEQSGVVSYSIDKTNWQSSNAFIINENGEYTFYAKDAVGNISEGESIQIDKIDTIAPVISVTLSPDSWTKDPVTMVVNATDSGCGLAEKAYKMDDGDWQETNEFIVSDSENHTFYVRDNLDNIAQSTVAADKHDVTNPDVSADIYWKSDKIKIDSKYIVGKVTYTLKVNATDDKSGVNAYSVDGENWQESNEFEVKGKDINIVYAKDLAGNVGAYNVKENIKVDNTAPTFSYVSTNQNPTNQGIVYNIIDVEDTESGLHKEAAYKMDDGEWQSEPSFTISDDEEHVFYVRDDAAGEPNVASQTVRATNFNANKPTIEKVNLSTEQWTNQAIEFSVIANGTQNKAGTEFPVVAYSMDDGEWQQSNSFSVSDCKVHSFKVKDSSGNVCNEAFEWVAPNYDAALPVLQDGTAIEFDQQNKGVLAQILNKLTFGRFFNEQLAISVKAKDVATEASNVSGVVSAKYVFTDTEGISFEFEANEIKSGNPDTSIDFVVKEDNLPDFFKGTAKVILTDAAGNVNTIDVTTANSDMGELPADNTFMIENDKPVIIDEATDITTCGGLISKSNYTLEFKVNDIIKDADKSSGIAYVSVKVNDQEVASGDGQVIDYQKDHYTNVETYSIYADADNYTVNGVKLDDWNDGVLKYEISACDNAGNVSDITELTYRFDQTAPIISNIEISKKEASKVAVFDYGFFFNEDTAITFTASDALGEKEATASGVKGIKVYLVGEYYQDAAKADPEQQGNIIYTYDANGSLVKIDSITEAYCFLSNSTDTEFSTEITVPANFKGQIYALAVDNAENSAERVEGVMQCRYFSDSNYDVNQDGYVHPDGTVVETPEMHRENSDITIKMPDTAKTQNEKFDSSKVNIPVNENGNRTLEDKKMDYKEHLSKPVALYNKADNRDFTITVNENFSGIQKVQYYVFQGDYTFGSETAFEEVEVDVHGNLSDGSWNPVYERDTGKAVAKDTNLVVQLSKTITVDGNYNDMVLLVVLTDRAGNMSYDYVAFGIDTSKPKITVEYDENNVDSGKYFKRYRTATVIIQERNFNKENVKWAITALEGRKPEAVYTSFKRGNGNRDNDTYIFTIKYEEGKFLFDVSYTDRANNKNEDVAYLGQPAPQDFVIDVTQPIITVSYDNDSAQNEKYFKNYRTATITIVEHNYDPSPSRVDWTKRTAANPASAVPEVEYVGQSGDTYTYRIAYTYDGDFTFDFSMIDMAGNANAEVNYGSSVAPKDFTVDTTFNDIVKIEGINPTGTVLGLDKSTGKIDVDATIRVTIDDTNLQDYKLNLYRTRVNINGESHNEKVKSVYSNKDNINKDNEAVADSYIENNVEVTSTYIKNASGSANTVVEFSIPERTEGVVNDGLYTLHVEASDKAGNTYEDACKNDSSKSIDNIFSVNRHGSVYVINNDFYHLLKENDGYLDTLQKDIEIVEYNPDELSSTAISYTTQAGETKLKESNTNNPANANTFTKSLKKDNNTDWNEYTYKLNKAAFTKDGEYGISLSSTDAKQAPSMSDNYSILRSNFKFVVDTKAPVLDSIEPMDKTLEINKATSGNGRVSTDKLGISFKVSDAAHLDRVEVLIDGELVKTYQYTDKKIAQSGNIEYFNDKKEMEGYFEIEGKSSLTPQNYQIVAYDKTHQNKDNDATIIARHILDTNAEGFDFTPYGLIYNKLVVTSNWLVQFYASITGWIVSGVVVAAIAGTVVLIVLKKRNKSAKEAK